jgi:SAM-dependent methyltransferase
MSTVQWGTRTRRLIAGLIREARAPKNLEKVDYEGSWDDYARLWRDRYPKLTHIGDEWTGGEAGAAAALGEFEELIETRFISPYVDAADAVLEIGVGGGRTAALLKKHCRELICMDISDEMLKATKQRLGDDGVKYVKVDGIRLSGVRKSSVDVCFCFDTMVHLEPRDIFNYLTQIPALMRGNRLCVFHHTNTLSDRGWKRFLSEWDRNLMGRRGGSFSVMTNPLMERFLTHLGYEILKMDTESVPRDCVWIARAPVRADI